MGDKLCVSERRIKILDMLVAKKQISRSELSREFNVSLDTISRDIIFLSKCAPIYTKTGIYGGIYLLGDFKNHRIYLTNEEEQCLKDLMKDENEDVSKIIEGILERFARKYVYDSKKK